MSDRSYHMNLEPCPVMITNVKKENRINWFICRESDLSSGIPPRYSTSTKSCSCTSICFTTLASLSYFTLITYLGTQLPPIHYLHKIAYAPLLLHSCCCFLPPSALSTPSSLLANLIEIDLLSPPLDVLHGSSVSIIIELDNSSTWQMMRSLIRPKLTPCKCTPAGWRPSRHDICSSAAIAQNTMRKTPRLLQDDRAPANNQSA